MSSAGVACVANGRVLLLRRSDSVDKPGLWAFPGGGIEVGETAEEAARRELSEEIGLSIENAGLVSDSDEFSLYRHDCDWFNPVLNDEHDGYVWATADALPQPLHPGTEELLSKMADQEKLTKECFAMDKSVRSYDQYGRLRVEQANISKANVCGYLGSEVPGWQAMGLEPKKIYKFYRDPDELAKAAATFNGIPILDIHVSSVAWDHPHGKVVGATGTDAVFEAPYLKNSLCFWTQDAIDGIESQEKRELSPGYGWRPDMTPGTVPGTGEAYDGVMRDLHGNHLATVEEGRTGSDIIVGDAAIPFEDEEVGTRFFLAADAGWNESDHPRGEGGKFGSGGKQTEKSGGKIAPKSKALKDAFEALGNAEKPAAEKSEPVNPETDVAQRSEAIGQLVGKEALQRQKDRANAYWNKSPEEQAQVDKASAEYTKISKKLERARKNARATGEGENTKDVVELKSQLEAAKKIYDDLHDNAPKGSQAQDTNFYLSSTSNQPEVNPMTIKALSKKAVLAKGALMATVKLAADKKLDLDKLLTGVTSANFKTKKTEIAKSIRPLLANDADIAGVVKLLDHLDAEEQAEEVLGGGDEIDATVSDPAASTTMDADPAEELMAFLEGKLSPEDMAVISEKLGSLLQPGEPATPAEPAAPAAPAVAAEDEPPHTPGTPEAPGNPNGEEMISKTAMDAAVKAAANGAERNAIKRFQAIQAAEEDVRPLVGKLAMSFDSAEGVYKAALENLEVDLTGVHPSAYKAIFSAQSKPGERQSARLANDAKPAAGFSERFPGLASVRRI